MDTSLLKQKTSSFWKSFKAKWNKIRKHEYFKAFTFTFLVGFFLFAIEAVPNGLTLFLNGDYSLQSLSFYADGYTKMWNFIKTGEFPMFDYSNLFGENYIGSQSFYYLGSPFFWLLLLVPRPLLYQGIYLMMIVKLAVGGMFFYILLRKYFNISEKVSLIGACCYAFSGWTMYYLWFHFGDVLAFFPLIIIGIEKVLRERKGGVLTLGLFLCCITNYFFGATFVIFGVMYALFRWIQIYGFTKRNGYKAKERWGVLLQGILYYIAGVGLAAFILLPASVSVADSGRAESNILDTFLGFFMKSTTDVEGNITFRGLKSFGDIFSKKNLTALFDFSFKWEKRGEISATQTRYYIFSNFFFINSNCWGGTLFNNPDLDNNLGGFFVTTPIALLLVPSLIRAIKTKKKWTIFGCVVCLIAPFLPITFYIFHVFTYPYGRWQIIIVLVSLIFLLKTLDNFDDLKLHEFIPGALFNMGMSLYLILYSLNGGTLESTYTMKIFGEYRAIKYQMLIVWIQLAYMFIVSTIIIVVLILKKCKVEVNKNKVKQGALILVIFELFIQATVTVNQHGYAPYSSFYGGQSILNSQRKVINKIEDSDGSFYRIYNEMATRGYVNHPSTLSYNGLSMFNSIYNNENDDFIMRSRLSYNNSWIAAVHEKRNYLDEFLGVKYYVVSRNDPNNDGYYFKDWSDHDTADLYYEGRINQYVYPQEYKINIPSYYKYVEELSNDDFMVFENTHFIELGFAYDKYIPSSVLGPNFDSYLSPTNFDDSSFYEQSYFHNVVIEDDDLNEEFLQKYIKVESRPNYSNTTTTLKAYNFKKYLKPREDVSVQIVEDGRDKIEVTYNADIKSYFENSAYGAIMHGRWTDHQSYDENGNLFSNPLFGDQIVIEPKNAKICDKASDTNTCNLNIKFQMGPQVVISLFNGDTLITQDAHMTHNYSMSKRWGEYKLERGFYSNQEVTKIVIEFINDANMDDFELNDFQVKFEYQNDYEKALQPFKDNAPKNIVYKTNSFTFKTDYDKPKLLVLNVPYDAGWSMKINGKVAKIYSANGGFVMVEAPEGEAPYELSYYTPRLKIGFALTGISALFLLGVSSIYNKDKIIKKINKFKNRNKKEDANLNKEPTKEEKNEEEFQQEDKE